MPTVEIIRHRKQEEPALWIEVSEKWSGSATLLACDATTGRSRLLLGYEGIRNCGKAIGAKGAICTAPSARRQNTHTIEYLILTFVLKNNASDFPTGSSVLEIMVLK